VAKDPNDQTLVERVDPLLGAVFDRRYRIEERLAAGGFGAIYRAEHLTTKRHVALKVLLPSLTHDKGVIARFRREGATLTALRSPNTITAYELGEAPDGTLYIVMELLRGVTLFERFRSKGRIPWRTMVAIARAVCNSLEEAHGLGIVHRDLKPTNIHLEPGPDGEVVKVLDFGIAKILRDSDFDSSDLTNAGQMIGTLDYMSPEQMVGGACTGQSDIYTLGIVMYEMVAGRRPFAESESAAATLAQMLKSTPTPLEQHTQVPHAFNALVMRCLDRDPSRRYPDVRVLGAELEKLAEHDSEVTRTLPVEIDGDEMTIVGSGRGRGGIPRPEPGRPVHEPAPTHLPMDALLPVPTPMRVQPPPDNVKTPTPIRVTPPPGRTGRPPTAPPLFAAAAAPRSRPPTPPPPIPPAPPLGPMPTPPPMVAPVPYGSPAPGPHTPPPGAYPPYGAYPPPARPAGVKQYDMASIAAREEAIRRIVWIAVLVLGTIVGVVLAMQL
jgi:serine/threonine-protein kinase